MVHVHGQAVAYLFAGDDLYGVDMSLPIHERVEKAKKQVAKDRANATLAAAARGVSAGGIKKKSGVAVGAADSSSNSSSVSRITIRSG